MIDSNRRELKRDAKVLSSKDWNNLNASLENTGVGYGQGTYGPWDINIPSDTVHVPHKGEIYDHTFTQIVVGKDRGEDWYPFIDSIKSHSPRLNVILAVRYNSSTGTEKAYIESFNYDDLGSTDLEIFDDPSFCLLSGLFDGMNPRVVCYQFESDWEFVDNDAPIVPLGGKRYQCSLIMRPAYTRMSSVNHAASSYFGLMSGILNVSGLSLYDAINGVLYSQTGYNMLDIYKQDWLGLLTGYVPVGIAYPSDDGKIDRWLQFIVGDQAFGTAGTTISDGDSVQVSASVVIKNNTITLKNDQNHPYPFSFYSTSADISGIGQQRWNYLSGIVPTSMSIVYGGAKNDPWIQLDGDVDVPGVLKYYGTGRFSPFVKGFFDLENAVSAIVSANISSSDELVKCTSGDTTAGYLFDKLDVEDNSPLTLTLLNPGGNESVRVDFAIKDVDENQTPDDDDWFIFQQDADNEHARMQWSSMKQQLSGSITGITTTIDQDLVTDMDLASKNQIDLLKASHQAVFVNGIAQSNGYIASVDIDTLTTDGIWLEQESSDIHHVNNVNSVGHAQHRVTLQWIKDDTDVTHIYVNGDEVSALTMFMDNPGHMWGYAIADGDPVTAVVSSMYKYDGCGTESTIYLNNNVYSYAGTATNCYRLVGPVPYDASKIYAGEELSAFNSCTHCTSGQTNWLYSHCDSISADIVYSSNKGDVFFADNGACYYYVSPTSQSVTSPAPYVVKTFEDCDECTTESTTQYELKFCHTAFTENFKYYGTWKPTSDYFWGWAHEGATFNHGDIYRQMYQSVGTGGTLINPPTKQPIDPADTQIPDADQVTPAACADILDCKAFGDKLTDAQMHDKWYLWQSRGTLSTGEETGTGFVIDIPVNAASAAAQMMRLTSRVSPFYTIGGSVQDYAIYCRCDIDGIGSDLTTNHYTGFQLINMQYCGIGLEWFDGAEGVGWYMVDDVEWATNRVWLNLTSYSSVQYVEFFIYRHQATGANVHKTYYRINGGTWTAKATHSHSGYINTGFIPNMAVFQQRKTASGGNMYATGRFTNFRFVAGNGSFTPWTDIP